MEALIQFCHHWILIFFFLPCCDFLLKNTLQHFWILAGLLLFSLVSTFFFFLEENLFPWDLTSNYNSLNWSCGVLVEVEHCQHRISFLANQTTLKYNDLNYLRIIRTFFLFLYEIENFWFGLQHCQKLDSLSECKNSLLYQL